MLYSKIKFPKFPLDVPFMQILYNLQGVDIIRLKSSKFVNKIRSYTLKVQTYRFKI